MNTLVVYYSRTGTTKKVGEKLASLLKCTSEEIRDTKSRKGIFGWLSAGKDATREALTELEKVENDPASFDIVVIGTPVWNHRMSTAVRTYLTQYKDSFRRVAFFCTYQYTDSDPFEEMASLCGKTPVATLRLHRKKEVKSDQCVAKTEEFVGRLVGT
jgi:menaquinone-dependent protoporphyrinogen IX oxidase